MPSTPSIPVDDPSRLFDERISIESRSAELERLEVQVVLRAAFDVFGSRAAISTAFGPTGLCLLHLARAIEPDVRVYSIDTGFLFEETYALQARWREEQGLRFSSVLPVLSPQAQAIEHGERLWERDPDLCCALRKKAPNEAALADVELWITALRRDGGSSRAATPLLSRATLSNGRTLLKLAPLAPWSHRDVWRYIHANRLPYNELHDRGYPSVGCTHCTSAVEAGGAERDGRWRGRAKTECGLHS